MNIVISPDAYKGSLTQTEVASIIANGLNHTQPNSNITLKPMADGGEGTLEVVLQAFEGSKRLDMYVTGPAGKQIEITVGIIKGDTAVVEIAGIVGLPLLEPDQLDPYLTTTFGIGEAIMNLLDQGIRKFVIGLGGSATNDGGLGMLISLGATIRDATGKKTGVFGADLMTVETIDLTTIDNRLSNCEIEIASDVTNPLYGPTGATHTFGRQKGATTEQMHILDQALCKYGQLIEQMKQSDLAHKPGSGAAGGLGFALLVLGGKIMSGAKLVAEIINLESHIQGADLIITGEGKSDAQTLLGKAPGYVATIAKQYEVPVYLISGQICHQSRESLSKHFDGIYSITNESISTERAIQEANVLLFNRVSEIFRRV